MRGNPSSLKITSSALIALGLSVQPVIYAQPYSMGSVAPAWIDARSLETTSLRLKDQIREDSSHQAQINAEASAIEKQLEGMRESIRVHGRFMYRLSRSNVQPGAQGLEAWLVFGARMQRIKRIVVEEMKTAKKLERRVKTLRAESTRLDHSLEQTKQQIASIESRILEQRVWGENVSWPSIPTQSWPPSSIEASGQMRVHDSNADTAPTFASLRGHLAMPIAGRADVRDGERSGDRGIEVLAPAGTPVRCTADGTVAFASAQSGYGQLVLVEHTGGYFTVYGGLGVVSVRVGDFVSRGARLGLIGESSESSLFFGVRQGTRSLNARTWLGL